jgi:thymidylate synthase
MFLTRCLRYSISVSKFPNRVFGTPFTQFNNPTYIFKPITRYNYTDSQYIYKLKKMADQINVGEVGYLNSLRKIMDTGDEHMGRNGKTLSVFGERLEFNIEDNFPLLTTKKMFWKGIVGELVWFLNANTNAKELNDMGVKIWDGNSSREYLDSIGLTDYEEGECGPIYGFQWRNFNGTYKGSGVDYLKEGDGVDQLQEILDQIRTTPGSRRMVMSAWNPAQADKIVLPCCHLLYQFYVNDGKLSCQMYQRSADMFLGVPFNIASTALLTHIIAHLTGLKPGRIIIVIGDAHIYAEHIEAVKKQLKREPKSFCQLKIKEREDDSEIKNPEDFRMDDFELIGYDSHRGIKAQMIP